MFVFAVFFEGKNEGAIIQLCWLFRRIGRFVVQMSLFVLHLIEQFQSLSKCFIEFRYPLNAHNYLNASANVGRYFMMLLFLLSNMIFTTTGLLN